MEIIRIGYFEEAPGRKSSTRLMCFLAAIGGITSGVASVFMANVTIGDALPMVITLLTFAAGTKVFQKFAEKK